MRWPRLLRVDVGTIVLRWILSLYELASDFNYVP